MKTTKLIMLVMTIAVALFILIPNLSWADDGATVYKAKCAACHGADAAGKPAAKIPSLNGDDAKKLSDADLAKAIPVSRTPYTLKFFELINSPQGPWLQMLQRVYYTNDDLDQVMADGRQQMIAIACG